MLLGASGAAGRAQAIRPNILILFDTSGSMLYNQANDGSPLCAGGQQANGQTSRIYNMKHALRDALAEVGTDEANFGLMRFPQSFNTAQARQLPQRLLDQRRHRGQRHPRLPHDDADATTRTLRPPTATGSTWASPSRC